MHVFFSGIGGMAISALAVMTRQVGHRVSGSDPRSSKYLDYLRAQGITDVHIGVDADYIARRHAICSIDWCVAGSAQIIEYPDHPEFAFCREAGIRLTKRGSLLSSLITQASLPLIAVAGTHGKTTTTAMMIWLLREHGVDLSYAVGAPVDGVDMGRLTPSSQYFVYEADEYDRNFLEFRPDCALITGIDWDHPDIYPTRDTYYDAFREFLDASKRVVLWDDDAARLGYTKANATMIAKSDQNIHQHLRLLGKVNRENAWLVANAASSILDKASTQLGSVMNSFPGVSRRFEAIAPGIYSDYAHTPTKIRGALQCAQEKGGNGLIVVYEGLHNTRQHFIRADLEHIFDEVTQLYVVPTFLGREDKSLEILDPRHLVVGMSAVTRAHAQAAELDHDLASQLKHHLAEQAVVLCLSAGHTRSLDSWVRQEFGPPSSA